MATTNLSICLAERPTGGFIVGQTFTRCTSPAPSSTDLKDGEILVEVLYLSLDPAMRGWVRDERSYLPPVPIGGVMRGVGVGRVLESKSKLAAQGELVTGFTGWTQYAVMTEGQFEPAPRDLRVRHPQDLLSVLGHTGITAWWGMTEIGNPGPGETVVVSAAAGATGYVAGQIARIKGARVVGICGSDDKCDWLVKELGFAAALNYKADDFETRLKEETPDFINVYFDNVAGHVLDLCLGRAKERARFVACGFMSGYNASAPPTYKNLGKVTTMRIRMQGFVITDHIHHFTPARRELATWIQEGKLKTHETVIKGGLPAAEGGLVELFNGANKGKMLVEVKNPEEPPASL